MGDGVRIRISILSGQLCEDFLGFQERKRAELQVSWQFNGLLLSPPLIALCQIKQRHWRVLRGVKSPHSWLVVILLV